MPDKIDLYNVAIDRIETHRAEMEKTRKVERKKCDLYISGYYKGIVGGLEAAINIIKKMKDEHYDKLADAAAKKAQKELTRQKK